MSIGSFRMADAADEWAVAARMGRNEIDGTAGNDRLTGTAGDDDFSLGAGGNDTARGLGGNDRFFFGDSYTPKDMVDGGDGSDVVRFTGDSNSPVTIDPENFQSIERISLHHTGDIYYIEDGFNHLFVGGGDNRALIDGSALTTGSIVFRGDMRGEAIGGHGNDVFFSSPGHNIFIGGGGGDKFVYSSVEDSSNPGGFDTIRDFDQLDVIKVPGRDGGYHLSSDAAQPGEVSFIYDAQWNQTILQVHLDQQGEFGNLTIHLDGDLSLTVVHDSHIVLG